MEPMKTPHFFPRETTFWLYHAGSVLFVVGISMISTYLYGSWEPKSWADSVAWTLPFTFAMLGFRWCYKRWHWDGFAMGALLPVVVGFGTFAGAVIASITTAAVTPFFWDHIVASQMARDPQFDATLYFVRAIVGGALQSQLFVSAWAFIYISVTSNRRIKETEVVNLRLTNSLKEAQLSSLSNQLNPHFLFNALNNIRFMIHENARQADAMVVALSDILRYSLASSEHEKVTLQRELAVIEQYIAIVKVQMEQRLQLQMAIDPALLQWELPPMVLQMLVENAIKHGLDQLPLGGTLRVEARAVDRMLVLSVVNDVPVTAAASQASMGIGLKNIQQRLRLLYGDKATLTIAHGREQFSATVQLPLERVE
jgi:hypothetical protein